MSIENSESDLEFKNITCKKYSNNQKKKIAERVENLTSKKHFKQIFKIIYQNSDSFTCDSSGVYIKFNLLSDPILYQIETFINSIKPTFNHVVIPIPKNFTPYFSDEYSPNNPDIPLSNHEKKIMKIIESDNNQSSDYRPRERQHTTKIIIKPFNLEN
jgi:hypothetical protein